MRHRLIICLGFSLLIVACAPPLQSPSSEPTTKATKKSTTPALPDGKYYLNDGPPDDDNPVALADTPDAVVRWERLSSSRNRPYVALGKRYIPYRQLQHYRRRGIASWYGRRYHGRPTASGEIYNMYKMTAAHPVLPIPSYARVTRIDTGDSVIVRINDRGPFLNDRIVDLSYAAAARLKYIKAGIAEVIVEQIIPIDAPADAVGEKATGRVVETEDVPPPSGDIYIQLAAFPSRNAAEKSGRLLKQALPARLANQVEIYQKAEGLFTVQVGPYATRPQAIKDDAIICKQYNYCGFLSQRQTK